MMEFYVSGQSLKFFTPVIAADSLNYLTARVNFTDAEWDGYSKWLHFRQDEELGADTYDLQLDENNEITADQKLNLTVGQWEIYLTGTKEESRLTTVPVILTVQQSGLVDAPLHELPMSVAERVDFNASQALLLAQAVKDMADEGKFDGESFAIYGYFESEAALAAAFPEGDAGRAYGVGSAAPYDIYVWDSVHNLWVNNGPLQGSPGEKGENGTVFIPSVDANGNIFWTNDGGMENPAMVNIRGPKGESGAKGEDGEGAYEKAQEAGYTGTEATFYQALTAMPYHNARHLPDGADPIVVQTGNIKDASVTRAKLAQDALWNAPKYLTVSSYTLTLDDLGRLLMFGSSAGNADLTINVPDSVALDAPLGANFAVYNRRGTSLTVKFGSNTYSVTKGAAGFYLGKSYKMNEKFDRAAFEKIDTSTTRGYWDVIGDVEVVS